MLSLPDRLDRRVPLLAAANGTNITLTVLDAIRDRQIPQSDWPKVRLNIIVDISIHLLTYYSGGAPMAGSQKRENWAA